MEQWLAFAKGPLFRLTITLMVLGLLRLVVLQLWGIYEARARAGNKNIPFGALITQTIEWSIPVKRLHKLRPAFSFASFIFHIGMLLVPLFYIEHIALLRSGTGLGWPGFGKSVADPLTLITMAALVFLFASRVVDRPQRYISEFFDYFVLGLILVPFLTGFLMSHPTLLPIPYNPMYLVHMLAAELIFVLMPFTKLAHAGLFSMLRISSDIAWRFVPDAGEKVEAALGREGRV